MACLGDSFLARPKGIDDLSTVLAIRSARKQTTKALKKNAFEEFDFVVGDQANARMNSAKALFNPDDHEAFEKSKSEIARLLLHDGIVPSYRNSVTISCLEVFYINPDTCKMAIARAHAAKFTIISPLHPIWPFFWY